MPDVLTCGEALASVRVPTTPAAGSTATVSLAGAEANVAIGLARLGHECSFVGAVGDDALGRMVERTLRAEGVSPSLRRCAAPTGLALFTHRLPGLITVDYHRRGSAGSSLSASDLDVAALSTTRIVHVSGITPALSHDAENAVLTLVERAREAGAIVSFDVNFRSKLWTWQAAQPVLRRIALGADLIIGSADEIDLVADPTSTDPVAALAHEGKEVVVKRGSEGASVFTRSGRIDAPAVPVVAVDAVGAGDAFVAGYLSALLDGLGCSDRLARGCEVGAFAVSQIGDWEGLPTRAELPLILATDGTTVR